MANEFNIKTGVTINTKPAQKEYEVWKKSLEKNGLNLKFNIDTKSLTSANSELKKINTTTLSTANGFENVSNALAKAQEDMNNMARYSEKLETAKMNTSLREMSKVLGDINAPVKETSTTFEKWEDAQGKIITQTRKFDSELGTTITKVEQYKNTLGQTVTETTIFNDNWDKLSHNMEVVDDRIARTAEEEKKLAEAEKLASAEAKANAKETASMGRAMSKASTNTDSLANKIVTAAGKVALFKVSTTIVMGFYNAINDAKQAVLDYDAAMVEFNKVTPLSNAEIEKMLNNFDELSEKVGRTKTQLVEVATEMSKSGFGTSEAEITKMTELVSLYQNTADEELSAADASAVLISQMKAFDYTADEAIHILDSINKVSAEFAVSSGDIGRGLTSAGAALQTYGNDYDSTVGMITGATEIFQKRSQQVARGLNMIASRVASNTETLNEYGVETHDSNGQLLSTYEILKNLKPVWDSLDSSQKVSLGTTLSGVNQYKIFAAEMNNFDQVIKATEASLNSQGSTEKQNEEYTKGLQYAISQLQAQWEQFVLGEGGLQNTAKILINIGTATLKLVNDLGGFKTILIAIVGIVATVKADNILSLLNSASSIIPTLIENLNGFANAFSNARAEGQAFGTATSTALDAVGASATTAQLAFGALALIITAVTMAVAKYNQEQERLRQEAISSTETFRQNLESFQETKTALEDESTSREQLATVLEKTLDGYDAEGKSLDELNAKRQEAIDKIDEQIKKEAEEWQRKNSAQANKAATELTESSGYKDSDLMPMISVGGTAVASSDIQKWLIEGQSLYELYDNLSVKIDELNTKNGELTNSEQKQLETYENAYNIVSDRISEDEELAEAQLYYKYVLDGTNESLNEYNKFCEESKNYQNNVISSTEDLKNTFDDIAESYGFTKEELVQYRAENEELLGDLDNSSESWYEVAQAMLEAGESGKSFVDVISELNDSLTGLEQDYNSLSTAVADFNDNGMITSESLNSILELVREHSEAVSFDNGQLVLSEEYFQNQANAAINSAEAELIHETQSRLAAVAQGDLNKALEGLGTAADNTDPRLQYVDSTIIQVGEDASLSASQIRDMWAAFEGSDTAGYNKNQKEAVSQIENYFKTSMNGMEAYRKQINSSYDTAAKASAKSSGSAAKSSEDAWLKAYKAEKETIDAMYENGTLSAEQYQEKLLELQAKYLTDTKEHQEKYASEIKSLYEDIYKALKDSVKDSLDEMKDAHDKAEDALKKQHEAQEKSIKNQIELLKRQKEAVEDSYDAQIEALKREREEYENQLELMKLKESLAKAQQQYQYVMNENGRFEWTQDQNAVDEAQEELYEEQLKQAYEKQLQDLEDAKDAAVALYEQQIQDLEDYYDQVQEANDEAEEALEAHNEAIEEQYEKAIEDFDLYAEMLNNGQLAQIESENANWATRLTNLAQFVNSYNAMLAELGNEGATVSPSASFSGGNTKTSTSGSTTKYKMKKAKVLDVKKHASGVSSISDDELALVGDSPNQELVIGSKLNGVPLTLSSGSGVVNAKSTRSLAGLLNSIPNLGNNYNTTNNNSQHSIHIDTINLPQVKNGNDFVDYLQNFNVDMTANAYRFGS